ncbi:MAG: aminopeptidase N [Nocardioides sp.]
MSEIPSLTRDEAIARAALLDVTRYEITVDLRGLEEGEVWAAESTVTFTCREPGASTFLDCAADVDSATLNGEPIDLAAVENGRIPLTDLAAENVVVVSSRQSDTASGNGILRSVDPVDKLVYVWTSFECDVARRAWACFDQPDLKAPHAFTVHAPESWLVTSNGAPDAVEAAGEGGGRTWTFPDTPPLSTYVVVVNAGPFYEVRSTRGGHDLGIYCRQSLKAYLDRDAEELFDLTDRGLAFFGKQFGRPFAQERYDHVFVPNLGGAMENWGCVTWGDGSLYRSIPTTGQRARRAEVLLHEMAHQWFGDLVTMRWWDDLWLNEAFASWAASWASTHATEFTDAWSTFLAMEKQLAYREDCGPATHAIRGELACVADAMANFDAITYSKGASVLKQLAALVGDDAFVTGLQHYFRDHAWGNTSLADLISAVAEASGRDLDEWTTSWLDRSGPDNLSLQGSTLTVSSADGGTPRVHRLDIGTYRSDGDTLERVGTTLVETAGASTELDLPDGNLHLLNAGDLTFALLRPDQRSRTELLARVAELPDAVDRAVVVSSGYEQLLAGELASGDLLDGLVAMLPQERSAGVVEPFLALAHTVATAFTPIGEISTQVARLAEIALELTGQPDHAAPARRTLAGSASTAEHFAALGAAAEDDVDLAWRVLARRAALGEYDEGAVKALLARDADPDAEIRALVVRTSRPDEAAKDEAWRAVYDDDAVPKGQLLVLVRQALWQPEQTDLLLPFTQRYLDELPKLAGGGMLRVLSLVRGMFPTVGDQSFLDRAQAMVEDPGTDATVRSALLGGCDTLKRMLRARGSL